MHLSVLYYKTPILKIFCARRCHMFVYRFVYIRLKLPLTQIRQRQKTRRQNVQNPKSATRVTNVCKRHKCKECTKTRPQMLSPRLNPSSFFLSLSIPLRGSRCLSNLCGQKFLLNAYHVSVVLNAYHVSVVLICGDCLKVYTLQKIETLVLRQRSCRGAPTCRVTLAASAVLFSGVSPEFPLRI